MRDTAPGAARGRTAAGRRRRWAMALHLVCGAGRGGARRGGRRRVEAAGAGGAMVREAEAEARGNDTRTAVSRRARWRRVEVTDDERGRAAGRGRGRGLRSKQHRGQMLGHYQPSCPHRTHTAPEHPHSHRKQLILRYMAPWEGRSSAVFLAKRDESKCHFERQSGHDV